MARKKRKKIADGKKAEGKNRKNNMKSNFSITTKIFVRNFFLRLLNLIFKPILSKWLD